MITLYHVTPAKNLDSILVNGLVPTIGERSLTIGENQLAVYLYHAYSDLFDGLGNWLGDCFEESEELVILEVYGEGLSTIPGADYEVVVDESIYPDRIRVREYC